MKKIITLITFLLVCYTGCAYLRPIPERSTEKSAALGIAIEKKGVLWNKDLENIYFVKIEQNNLLAPARQIIPANYHADEQLYLLNAEPGTYIVVAASDTYSNKNIQNTTPQESTDNYFFPKEMIELTRVEVKPGAFAYMGTYLIDTDKKILYADKQQDLDKAQFHYARILAPTEMESLTKAYAYSFCWEFFGQSEDSYTARMLQQEKTPASETAFLQQALRDLPKGSWQPLLQRQLEALPASERAGQ
jgi:hypothetical protein